MGFEPTGTLYDEGGQVLLAPRKVCPVCGQRQLVTWRVGDEPRALCLNTDCEYEY